MLDIPGAKLQKKPFVKPTKSTQLNLGTHELTNKQIIEKEFGPIPDKCMICGGPFEGHAVMLHEGEAKHVCHNCFFEAHPTR